LQVLRVLSRISAHAENSYRAFQKVPQIPQVPASVSTKHYTARVNRDTFLTYDEQVPASTCKYLQVPARIDVNPCYATTNSELRTYLRQKQRPSSTAVSRRLSAAVNGGESVAIGGEPTNGRRIARVWQCRPVKPVPGPIIRRCPTI
jgi:hypothetical protein